MTSITPDHEKDTSEFILPPGTREAARVPSADVHVEVAALSHQGKVRSNNEDHYMVARFGRSLDPLLTNLPKEHVFPAHAEVGYGMVVADGMGGAAGGEIASRSAIQDLVNLVLATPDWIIHGKSPWVEDVMRRMNERFQHIDHLLSRRAAADPTLAGMGTTMTLAGTLGLDLVLCHIGDSRAYLYREEHLAQLTRDMTMAQELVDAGRLTAAQAATNPFRHVLTQCLGGPGRARAEVAHHTLRDGDRLLLCSDGLFDMVPDNTIADILRRTATAQDGCQSLVDRALEAGGKDNVTVVVAHYHHGQPAAAS
jgi:protein phosphatase